MLSKPSNRLAKIKWQCRRGMLELDLVLNRFVEKSLQTLTTVQLEQFEKLLTLSDPALYSVLIEGQEPEEVLVDIVKSIQLKP